MSRWVSVSWRSIVWLICWEISTRRRYRLPIRARSSDRPRPWPVPLRPLYTLSFPGGISDGSSGSSGRFRAGGVQSGRRAGHETLRHTAGHGRGGGLRRSVADYQHGAGARPPVRRLSCRPRPRRDRGRSGRSGAAGGTQAGRPDRPARRRGGRRCPGARPPASRRHRRHAGDRRGARWHAPDAGHHVDVAAAHPCHRLPGVEPDGHLVPRVRTVGSHGANPAGEHHAAGPGRDRPRRRVRRNAVLRITGVACHPGHHPASHRVVRVRVPAAFHDGVPVAEARDGTPVHAARHSTARRS